MFDKLHLTFNFKSKVSRDVFKNKIECQSTSTFYSIMSPQFWLTQYSRKTNILNNQYAILISNKKRRSYQLSVSNLQFCLFLQMLKTVAHSIASTSSPQRETNIRVSTVFKFQPIAQVAFDCILYGKPSFTLPRLVPSESRYL